MSETDPWVGRTLGDRYAIEALVGEGTTGVVYRARHVAMNKPVAVKLLHGVALGSRRAEMEERFRLEAQVYGQITHPNVCTATDFGITDEGVRYLVMELLTGHSLFDLIAEEAPLDIERAVSIASQIAQGLGAVHGCEVVHRDLKPENIFLVNRGGEADQVKLVDFGIARNMDAEGDRGRLTEAGMIYGTPAYLAPEQARSMEVDGRADLYAAGVILFEMLTGRLPFERETSMALLQAHAHDAPPRVRSLRPEVGWALDGLVSELLVKDPAMRVASASELHKRLQVALQPGGEPPAGPFETERFAASVTPPRPFPWSTLAALAVAVTAFVTVLFSTSDDSASPGPSAPQAQGVSAGSPSAGTQAFRGASGRGAAATENLNAFKTEKRAFEERREIQLALSQRQANPQLALNELRRVSAAETDNPHAHYHMGLTFFDQGRGIEAAESWQKALKLDARYRHDQELAQRLVDGLLSTDAAEQAAMEKTLAEGGIIAAGGEAISRLVRDGTNLFQLGRLHNAASGAGVLARMQSLDRFLLELRSQPDCDRRKKALRGLEELGDKRALGVLKRLQHNRRGCGPGGNDDCIECIRPQLETLIGSLE